MAPDIRTANCGSQEAAHDASKCVPRKEESAPKVLWKDWYNLYTFVCLAFLMWMEQNAIVAFAEHLSNPQQYLDNGLRIFMQLLLFMKMAANYLCMFLRSSKIISFYERASAFEDRIGIPWCGCCSPRRFFWSDIQRAFTCILYCTTAMFSNSLSSYMRDNAFTKSLACTKLFFHMVFYFVYDSIYVVALRSSSQVLCTYLDDQLSALRRCIESQAFGFGGHAGEAQRVQAVRLNLATVHQLKEEVNDIWRWPLVISSLCVLLLPCMCVHEASQPGYVTEKRYVTGDICCVLGVRIHHAGLRQPVLDKQGLNTSKTPISQSKAEGQPCVTDMASAMAENFRVCGWLCRAAGVFFIRNIQAADVDEMEVTWKSWYTLYSVACLSTLAATNVEFVATKMMELSTKPRTFTKVLFLIVPLAMSSKVLVNIFSAILGSGKMKEFLRNAFKHEVETSFWRQRYRYRSHISYVLRFFMGVAFTVNIVVIAHMIMNTAEFGNSYYLDLLRVVTIIGTFLFFFYDVLYSISLRPCCHVLIAYVRHQHAIIRAVLPTVGHAVVRPLGVTGVAELQRVKANLRFIGKLRQLLNDVWQYSLAVSSGALLIVGCITVYCTFDNGMPLNQILLSLSYFVYSALDFIDVARLSHAMTDEVRALKATLERASMHQSSAAELRQVAHLYISIQPEDMSLKGGNFFTLDLPLLVSIAGSVITYSVILVQTSDDVEHHQLPHKTGNKLSAM
ncbi:hypothetical protein MRX96_021664 [Rhipicephalus microplus]